MSKVKRSKLPFYWSATPTMAFTTGTADTVSLSNSLTNPRSLPVRYTVASGSLPAGCTLDATSGVVTYDGVGAATTASVTFTATWSQYAVTCDTVALEIEQNVTNTAPVFTTSQTLTPATAGVAFTRTITAEDADGDAITLSHTEPPPGTTVTILDQVGNTRSLEISGTIQTAGDYTITVTADDGQGSGDFATRAAGPGVVWAHDFTEDAELTNFFKGATDEGVTSGYNQANFAKAYLVSDAQISGRAMRNRCWGSTIATEIPAGNSGDSITIHVADADLFPDPASEPLGKYTLMIGAGRDEGEYVTVTSKIDSTHYQVLRDQAVDGTATGAPALHAVGTKIGIGPSAEWNRPLCAFQAGDSGNGKATPDQAAQNTMPLRVWPNSDVNKHARWPGANWGHPDYHAQYPYHSNQDGTIFDTRTWDTNALTGSAAWEGDEFWLQFKIRFSTDNPADKGKYFYLHNASSSGPNQIYANHAQWPTPVLDTNGQSGPVAPYGTKISSETGYASGGELVMVGNTDFPSCTWPSPKDKLYPTCWNWEVDQWYTLMLHVKPGHHNYWDQTETGSAQPVAEGVPAAANIPIAPTGGQTQETITLTVDPAIGTGMFPDPASGAYSTRNPGAAGNNYYYIRARGALPALPGFGSGGVVSTSEVMKVIGRPSVVGSTVQLTVIRRIYSENLEKVDLTYYPANTGPSGTWEISYGPYGERDDPRYDDSCLYDPVLTPPTYNDSTIEYFVAAEGDTTWTTLTSRTDFRLVFGGQGTISYFGEFPPGYNSFNPRNYPNPYIAGLGAPGNHWIDYAEIILSREQIPVPA